VTSVLLVDDDDDLRVLLRVTLTEQGFEIVGEARDGLEGVEQAARLQPDVILLDLTMPTMDGVGLLEIMRSYLRWHLVRDAAPWLSSAFVNEDFAFRQVLSGTKELFPRWRRCLDETDADLGEALMHPEPALRPSPSKRCIVPE
jgi:CheY-like chemotaxis protein